jgi:hypothetical protein
MVQVLGFRVEVLRLVSRVEGLPPQMQMGKPWREKWLA